MEVAGLGDALSNKGSFSVFYLSVCLIVFCDLIASSTQILFVIPRKKFRINQYVVWSLSLNSGEHKEGEKSSAGKKQKDTARNTQDELVRNTHEELADWKIQDPDKGPSYTVSEYMEGLGHGNYTRWVTFVMSLVSFADSAEIAVTAVIISKNQDTFYTLFYLIFT